MPAVGWSWDSNIGEIVSRGTIRIHRNRYSRRRLSHCRYTYGSGIIGTVIWRNYLSVPYKLDGIPYYLHCRRNRIIAMSAYFYSADRNKVGRWKQSLCSRKINIQYPRIVFVPALNDLWGKTAVRNKFQINAVRICFDAYRHLHWSYLLGGSLRKVKLQNSLAAVWLKPYLIAFRSGNVKRQRHTKEDCQRRRAK